jgi:hypothetical protein
MAGSGTRKPAKDFSMVTLKNTGFRCSTWFYGTRPLKAGNKGCGKARMAFGLYLN